MAPETPLEPVAQPDEAEAEEDEPGGRGVAGAREQRHEAGKLAERAGGGQDEDAKTGGSGEQAIKLGDFSFGTLCVPQQE